MRVICLYCDGNVFTAIPGRFAMFFHTAFGAFLIFEVEKGCTYQFAHAIMLMQGCSNRKV